MPSIWLIRTNIFGKKKGKVFVGLSGGVDSAVSAALLKREGYDVTGVFIRITVPGYPCTAGEDKLDALRAAAHLRIPFVELDLSKEYEEEVFKRALKEFKAGRTPNPDALCNKQIKFGTFYKFARERGADFIATGHYARINNQGPTLIRGADPSKDQSYFLWMVPQEALAHALFPIGGMLKKNVRKLAKKFKLPNAARKDSQGLCFLGPVSVDEMLEAELKLKPGKVLDEKGRTVGVHRGAALYTLGQRHGFELTAQSPDTPAHYVVAKNIKRNTITVSPNKFPQGVSKTVVTLREQNWIGPRPSGACTAQYRYHMPLIPAVVLHTDEKTVVELEEPHTVPLGQSLVLYDALHGDMGGERILGGGVIDTVEYR